MPDFCVMHIFPNIFIIYVSKYDVFKLLSELPLPLLVQLVGKMRLSFLQYKFASH
jgi:hypothetical protein